jgi:hypothetical protein
LTTLLMFFLGVALCFVRAPKGDRWHAVLCAGAVALWLGVLLIDPRARTAMFALITGGFLIASLRISSQVPQP